MPSDLSELRGLIVCVTFIATAITLIALMPNGFFPPTVTQIVNPKQGFLGTTLAWNSSTLINFTGPNNDGGVPCVTATGELGGNHYILDEVKQAAGGGAYYYYFSLQQSDYYYFPWGVLEWNFEDANWYYSNMTQVSTYQNNLITGASGYTEGREVIKVTDIDKLWNETTRSSTSNSSSLEYIVQTSHWTMQISFLFNTTKYAFPSSAYFAVPCNLQCMIWLTYDERASSVNAWTLISGMMFFQLIPNLPVAISLLIEAPIWVAEIYLIFSFTLRVISALMGGG